jgi:type III secretion protein U
MSGSDDSGDKTEEPTDKKLQDARKKGQVAKSKDLTSTLELLVWLVMASLALVWAGEELVGLFQASLGAIGQPFGFVATSLGWQAVTTLLALTAALLLPVAAVGMLVEFLQVGPLVATEKLSPKFENLDPVGGLKRMFSIDSLVELLKSLLKTSALLLLGYVAVIDLLPQMVLLPWSEDPRAVGRGLWQASRPLLAWSVGLFALLSVLDVVHQRLSFRKKMRMSMDDIKKEHKQSEGDPMIKGHRRQLAMQWAQQGAPQSAKKANVLVVNPTHVAIAIEYERETCPVPTVTAKGCEEVAREMRAAAEEAGVPILRNVTLARDLLARAEEGDVVPMDLFDVVAEVILWARETKDVLDAAAGRDGGTATATATATATTAAAPPGTPAENPPPAAPSAAGPAAAGPPPESAAPAEASAPAAAAAAPAVGPAAPADATSPPRARRKPPGEDLTRYSDPPPIAATPAWMRDDTGLPFTAHT